MTANSKPWKVCIHWSAGTYRFGDLEAYHYHYMINNLGVVKAGRFRPEDNVPPLRNGQYAAHCGGGNSYCIGVSLLGMAGFKNANNVGKYPLTAKQCEAAWAKVAELCIKYGIPIDPEHVFTHYEFGRKNPRSDSFGKIDIIYLPPFPQVKPAEVGDFIRSKVTWYFKKQLESK